MEKATIYDFIRMCKKHTDEQIIKAFEEVSEDNHMSTINQMICGDALNIIKRLKIENKELKERITYLEKSIDYSRKEYNQLLQKLQQAKSEAIKEFAKRLKGTSYSYSDICGYSQTVVDVDSIDNLVKEMTEVQE